MSRTTIRKRSPHRIQHASRQKGVVLGIALIVLVALMVASISIVRSVDTANVIAGNLAFKQTAVQAADFGIEAAVAALPDIVANTAETNVPSAKKQASPYWYYATRRDVDARGVPTTRSAGEANRETPATPIDWSEVPVATTAAGNAVQIVIERLCLGPAPVDIQTQCFLDGATEGNSQKPGAPVFAVTTALHYRVTARVSGPRNTVSTVQAILSR